MRLHFPVALLCLVMLAGCASAPPALVKVPALPEVRVQEVTTLLKNGSYLQALQDIDAMHRDALDAPAIDTLKTQALDTLAKDFNDAMNATRWGDALRLFDSLKSAGIQDRAGDWTEKSLLIKRAQSEEKSGDLVLALLTRLRVISTGAPTDDDYTAALALATRAGNGPAIRSLVAAMSARGMTVSQIPQTTAPTFAQMISGTVTIIVDKGIKVQNGLGYPDGVIGSGFFIDPRGYILTNHHVIESEVDPKYKGYSRLYVRFSDSPVGDRIPAKVLGYDATLDLALIKVDIAPKYVFSGSRNQSLLPGDKVYAIGSPAGLEKTITSGIISAMERRLQQVGDSMQVDVPVNPGNSGGPLFTESGNLVGVVFAGIQQYEGLNFAIPYTWVEKALPSLYKGGAAVHSWLGMAVAETVQGLEVTYTLPDEPAANADIRAGDIIDSVNGVPYAKLSDIQAAILDHSVSTLVTVGIRRGDAHITALVCLGQRPDQPIEVALKRDARDNVVYPLFGMQLKSVGSFFWKSDYLVTRVTKGSIADESGISENDPLTIQDWQVDTDKGYAALQIVIKKKKAGFLESAIQIAAYLETDNFI
jgi:serine protease Do